MASALRYRREAPRRPRTLRRRSALGRLEPFARGRTALSPSHGRVLAAHLLGLDGVPCIGRADRLSVEIKQVEKKVDKGIVVARIGRGLDHAERGCAIRPNAAQLTVKIRLRGGQRGQ